MRSPAIVALGLVVIACPALSRPVTDPRSDDSNSMRSGPPGDVASMKAFTDSGSDSAPPIASTGQSKREIPAVLARTTAVENVETNESSIDSAAGSVSHPLDTRDIPLSSSDVDNILHALPPRGVDDNVELIARGAKEVAGTVGNAVLWGAGFAAGSEAVHYMAQNARREDFSPDL